MKQEAINQLIKHLVIAGIAWIVSAIIFGALAETGIILGIIAGFMCAGVPFAWKWLSSIFISLSLYTLAIKVLLAIFLGWIALPVVIIKDVVGIATAA